MSEVEIKLRNKIGEDADVVLRLVKEDPDYFVMEGGSDGTWGHLEFHSDYHHLMPEIIEYAFECGGRA